MKTFIIIFLLHQASGSSASLETGMTSSSPSGSGAQHREAPLVSQESILTARLAIHASDSGAKSWILGLNPNDLVQEYNTATKNSRNLSAVKDLFKLTVYSIMCRKAITLMKSSQCPELNAESSGVNNVRNSVLSALYEMMKQVFPDSHPRIDELVNIVFPRPPIPLPPGSPPASGSPDPSLLTPL